MAKLKYLSLFSGIAGFELGIQNAYERIQNDTETGGCGQEEGISKRPVSDTSSESNKRQYPTCIGYSEIDKYAIQIYQSHFPEHKNYGDITEIKERELPDFDMLCGGFPCQSFSIAGKRQGFEDTRGTLFFDIARIIQAKQPRLLLLENVKGLLSHGQGRTFKTIIATLTELGYDLQWQVLNSKNFGVPQNRERVYIVGHLRGTPRPKVFPITESNRSDITQLNNPRHSNSRVYGEKGIAPTLNTAQGGNRQPKIIQRPRGKNQGGVHAISPTLSSNSFQDNNHVAKTVRSGGRGSPHGSKQNWDSYEIQGEIRRLTPKECERLQGFPDGWTEGVSDSQRYKVLGNAVTTNVVQAIMERILESKR